MKKDIKYFFIRYGLLVIIFFLLTGCGILFKKTKTSNNTELKWYFIGNGPQRDVELIENEVNKYLKDKLNVTVKLICMDWGSYDHKMSSIIAERQEFDICFTAGWTNNYKLNVAKGVFLDITELIDKYMPKTKELLGEEFLAGSAIGGRNYAIPANKEKAHNWGFIIRKDLAQKYRMNLGQIKSLEDLEPFLKIIKQREPNVHGLEAVENESPRLLLDWDKVSDDDIPVSFDRNGKVVFELEDPKTIQLFKTIHRFYKAGYIRQDAVIVKDFNSDEKNGRIFAATKSLKPGKDAEMTNSTGQSWVQVDITPIYMTNRETIGSLQAISKTSKNPEKALMFLELFNTDPYLNNLINYGIENVHYIKVADNIIKYAPDTDQGKNSGYNPSTGWMFGNQFLNYILNNEDPQKWQKYIEYNTKAVPLKTLGFIFNSDNVKDEMAACKAVWKEVMPALETGSLDPDIFLPQAIIKFRAAGVDLIINEAQNQFNEWINKKKS